MRGLRLEIGGYLFDLSQLPRALAETGRRRVLLEAPQGLVRLLPSLASEIEERLGVEALYRLEPSYGLCSASIPEARRLDAVLVHVGHDFYPYPLHVEARRLYSLPADVVAVAAEYLGGDAESLAEEVAGEASRVAVAYPSQHRSLASRLASALERRGVRVEAVEQVLGCYAYPLLRVDAEAYVVVAGGVFHALGVGLAARGEARVLRADPYTGRVEDMSGEVARLLAKRYWAMSGLLSARRVAVIDGLLPGQHRPALVRALAGLLRRRGIGFDIVYAERLTREYLDNLAPGSYDAYIVVSCPRLAVDDLGDYWKPVLAPGEARMVLLHGRVAGYSFPW